MRTACLDDQLAQAGVERVDLLKIDVEGWEPRVLEGAAASLAAGRIRAVLVELNGIWLQRGGSSMDALWDRLLQLGFVAAIPRPAPLRRDTLLNVPFFHRSVIRRPSRFPRRWGR